MPEPKGLLEFKVFDGGNWHDEPGQLPISETDLMKNVIGDGRFVQKRPGTRVMDVDCGAGNKSPAIFCEYRMGARRHILAMILVRPVGHAPVTRMAYLDLFSGDFTDLGEPAGSADIPVLSSMVATRSDDGSDAGYLASTEGWIVGTTASLEYEIASLGGGGEAFPDWCGDARHLAWFSEVLFAAGSPAFDAHVVAFSMSQRPEQLDPNGGSDDNFLTNPDGDLSPVLGMKRAGNDSLYIMKPESIERVTGTSRELFDRTTVQVGIGGANERGWADCYGSLVGFSVERCANKSGTGNYIVKPLDVLMLSGGKAVKIGYKIQPRLADMIPCDIGTGTTPDPNIPVFSNSMLAAFWKKVTPEGMEAAILIPNAPSEPDGAAVGPQTVFAYSLRNGAWWEWELPAELACTAITSAPMAVGTPGVPGEMDSKDRLIIGLRRPLSGNKLIAYFDADEPMDNGAPMESFGTGAWIDFGRGHQGTIESVVIRGRQKSGGPAKFSIAIDFDSTKWYEVREFDLTPNGVAFLVDNESLAIGASRFVKWRIDFAEDGVQSAYTFVNPVTKDRGPVKDSDNP